jgi:hypothetical protein
VLRGKAAGAGYQVTILSNTSRCSVVVLLLCTLADFAIAAGHDGFKNTSFQKNCVTLPVPNQGIGNDYGFILVSG